MTAISKTSAKAYFETGDRPTQAQFADLIDSYQDAASNLGVLSSAGLGTVGLQILSCVTSASAQAIIGGGNMNTSVYDPGNVAQQLVGVSATQSIYDKTFVRAVLTGRTDGTSPAAGSIGEVLAAEVTAAAATPLTSLAAKSIATLPLTAGDWSVYGGTFFTPEAATSITFIVSDISLTNNALDTAPTTSRNGRSVTATVPPSSLTQSVATGVRRINVSTSTNVFLVSNAIFTVSGLSAYGRIEARRVS